MYSMNRTILIVFCWLLCLVPCLADDTKEDKVFISTSKARSLAMGGAYTGVSHKSESLLWNPAGVAIPIRANEENGRGYLNSFAAPFVAAGVFEIMTGFFVTMLEWQIDDWLNGEDDDEYAYEPYTPEPPTTEPEPDPFDDYVGPKIAEEGANLTAFALPFFIKSVSVGDKKTAVTLNLAEDILPYPTLESTLENADPNETLYDNKSYHLGIKHQLAQSLSVGASLSYYHIFENAKHTNVKSFNLGILQKPMNNLSWGLTYFNEKPSALEPLQELERITDETYNFGASFKPDNQTEIACDIRNLADPDKPAYREFHYGIERNISRWVGLRGGYYKERDSQDDVFSFGLRIKNFSYTFVKNTSEDYRYHLIGIIMAVKF